MKRSQSITLTVVAAMAMAGRAQTPTAPAVPVPTQSCEERRSSAQAAGTLFTESCGHRSTVHGTSRGGFGATGKGHSGGG